MQNDTDNKQTNLPTTQTSTTQLDGFSGYTRETEGEDEQRSGNVIQGTLIRFTNDFVWVTSPDGIELPSNLELLVGDVARVVQKWIDQSPVETRFLLPGERFPDIKAMNAAAPKDEWSDGPAGPRGPYQAQHVLYLVDLEKMERYTYPTATIGGSIAISNLVDQIKWTRKFRGDVYPIVTLSSKHMATKFGGRERPHFEVVKWVAPDGSALPSTGPALPPGRAGALRPVSSPDLKEQMNDDEIKF